MSNQPPLSTAELRKIISLTAEAYDSYTRKAASRSFGRDHFTKKASEALQYMIRLETLVEDLEA